MREQGVLTRIKRLVIAGQVEFTGKALDECLVNGLTDEDVLESVLSANRIKKVLRSRSAFRTRREHLYVIESPSFDGIWIYTKGTIRTKDNREVFYVFISSKISE